MQYSERSYCGCCGNSIAVTVNAYGDYDGPEEMREHHPSVCLRCKGIALANPEMYKIMMGMYDRLVKERQKLKEDRKRIWEESFERHELYEPFHSMTVVGGEKHELRKVFDKEVKELNACTEDKNGDWVLNKAFSKIGFHCAKLIDQQKHK